MRRSDELAERLINEGKCPVEALVRLAERAEAQGDLAQSIGAWKSVLPYVYPKPKAVEIAPEIVLEMARDLAEVRARAAEKAAPVSLNHLAIAERYLKKKEAQREGKPQESRTGR